MFFTILAIIGKILLTILKILLFLLLLVLLVTGLVLFVPVRYDFSGSYHGNDIRAEGEASWLIHFISLRFWYRDGKTPYIPAFQKPVCGVGLLSPPCPPSSVRPRNPYPHRA